jgi:hypothetical protein
MRTTSAFLILFTFLAPLLVDAQGIEIKDLEIRFGGFIKSDFFYDSRQTVTAREGHFLLWPEKPLYDPDNNDINAAPSLNFLAIQTRLNAAISGPDAWGIKTSGFVEGAFFGNSNSDINGFRLRHAFVKFNWANSELLFGQFWNPLFVTSSFPDVVSFNTGTPFQPFSRNPQIRFTQSMGDIKFIAAVLSQRDFTNICHHGSASSSHLRNSALPDMHIQAHYTLGNQGTGSQFIFGGGIAYKEIVPELSTDQGYKTNAGVPGITYMGFIRAGLQPVTIKTQYVLGQNTTDLLMIGGYGISRITDPERGLVEYSSLQTSSFWVDMHTNGQSFQFGLFLGMSENIGATKDLVPGISTAGLGTNIKSLYRIAPRVIFNSGRARFAFETEYTGANFGIVEVSDRTRGIPANTNEVANLRLLLGVYLFF